MKLLDYSGLQRFLAKIKTLLDSKANAQHTHSTSDVTDLLSDQHTWSSQQSYNADLNLNYSSTDVDDIIDTLAGSYTAEDFLAQNNVWTGINQFTDTIRRRSTSYEIGNTPASNVSLPIRFTDKNNDSIGWVRSYVGTSGATETEIVTSNKFKNNALDPTGTQTHQSLKVGIDNTGSVYHQFSGKLKQSELPFTTDTYDLGSSSYQWNNVYAKNYYYNGTVFGDIVTHNASEFLTSHQDLSNYVTIDTAQDIEGNKNFKGLLTTIPNDTIWPVTASTTDDITYLGANAIHVEQKSSGKLTDLSNGAWSVAELGVGCFFFRINNGTDIRYKHLAQNTVNRIPVVSGANRFINDVTPNENNTYSLGTSSLRWSSCYSNAYYLGTTAFGDIVTHNASEFLTSHQPLSNYVTLNGAQTISATKTWTKSQSFKNTAITNHKENPTTDTEIWACQFWSNDNKYWGGLGHKYLTTGFSEVQLCMSNWTTSGSQGYWHLDFGAAKDFSSVYFRPSGDNNCYLGTSDKKWANVYATTFTGNLTGNVSGNVTGNCSGSSGSCTGNAATASKVVATVANDNTGALVQGTMGTNDCFRIAIGGASNAGWAEIATADDYNEPIYVRQYQGAFTTLKRTATLLDASGNTSFPGTVTATGFSGPLTGNVTGNCSGSSGSCTGNAKTATKATGNANGKELTNTIIKGLAISGKTITYTQIDGTTGTLTTQDTNTDTLMTQNVSTTNATYPILLCPTANATANQGAKTGIFAKSVKINPSTNVITASGFSGPLTGNVTGNCSGSSGSCTGNAANVTGTVAIAHGGTGATTRLAAVKALTDENVGTGSQYFLTITTSWGKAGYCSVADAKTVLGLGTAAYTASTAYAAASHTHSQYLTAHQSLDSCVKTSGDQDIAGDKRFTSASISLKNSGFTVGTAPSKNRYWTYFFADSANAGCGRILKYVNKDGSSGIEIQDYKYNNASTNVFLKVGFDSSGNAFSSSSTTFSAPCLKASTNNASNGIKIGTYTIYVG